MVLTTGQLELTAAWRCVISMFSCSVVSDSATPWTAVCQAPLSIGFSRQEYLSGLPCTPPGDLPNPGIEPRSPALQEDSLPTEPPGKPHNFGLFLCICGVCAHVHPFPVIFLKSP